MRRSILLIASLTLAACNQSSTSNDEPKIDDRSVEQKQLHQLDAFNLAVGLKRAIYDAGYTCGRVTDAGYVGSWRNLDMWVAHCENQKLPSRDWAIFAGPDGSAQVRDCKDIPGSGLPLCNIKERPKGSFNPVGSK